MARPTDLQLVARLVAFDSTSANSNRPIADDIAGLLDGSGATVRIVPAPDEAKVNLIAWLDGGAGDGLTLCGHLDVVPATEPQWASDPFEAVERDGRLYGRGTCDMKGFVALAINAFLDAAARPRTAPLALLLTCDEELGCVGAQRLAADWPADVVVPRPTIVGEPTSLRAVRLHKGHLTMRIVLHGKAAHSGMPHLGRSAIDAAIPVLDGLRSLRAELAAEPVESGRFFPEVPFTVLNVARVRGGEALNVIPERCVIDLGARLLPGQTSAPLVERIEAVVRDATRNAPPDTVRGPAVEVLNESPPMELPEDAAIYRELCGQIGQRDTHGVSYAADAGVLQGAGLECVLFGPGTIDVAHQPNEHVPIDELQRCRAELDALIARRCG